MLAKTFGCTLGGVDGRIVTVEVCLAAQLPGFDIVGLPDAAVREARERVRAAIKNSKLLFPRQRIIVNLAPADLKKEGPQLDLALALGVLIAEGFLKPVYTNWAAIGELALDGGLRPVRGVLPMVLALREAGIETVFLPVENAREALLVKGMLVIAVSSLRQTVSILAGEEEFTRIEGQNNQLEYKKPADFCDVKGQEGAKRALEVAAAGGHNLLMTGPPGSGKTMLARCVPSILPELDEEESLETTKIYSCAGLLKDVSGLISERPFRGPHHTITPAALVGGGAVPRPGEVSLSHNGVLFLDELPEFRREVLEMLRQPLEEGVVTISRLQATYVYPARFMLLASMNPCPCGFLSDPQAQCVCSSGQVMRYRRKISGPLLDRIDLFVEVPRLRFEEVAGQAQAEPSASIKKRVAAAREMQRRRFEKESISCNAQMGPGHVRKYCQVDAAGRDLLRLAYQRLHLSARAYDRILKVARTIADLDGSQKICPSHIAEAISYRQSEGIG